LQRVLEEFQSINKDKSNVILHADRDLPYSQLEQILVPIANAHILNVSYETKQGDDQTAQPGPTASAQ
jgi:biopolymer transport protein ExbD